MYVYIYITSLYNDHFVVAGITYLRQWQMYEIKCNAHENDTAQFLSDNTEI